MENVWDAYRTGQAGVLAPQAAQINNAAGALGILAKYRQEQDSQQIKGILANSPDLQTALPALLKAGPLGIQTAHQLAQVQKQQQDMELTKQMGSITGTATPDQLDAIGQRLALGAHPGASTVLNIADKRRAAGQQKDAITGMQSVGSTPAMAPLTPNDDEGNAMPGVAAQPGKGGVTDFLQASQFPMVAQSAKALQGRIDAGGAGLTPAMIDSSLNRLTQMHQTEQSKIDARAGQQANRIEIRNMFPPAAKGAANAVTDATTLQGDALQEAAARYKLDGTLPANLGRGTQGATNTVNILNAAAQLSKTNGDAPEASRLTQLANKAKASALTQMEKQATMVGAFEKNANMNADLALQFSEKADRTGVPVFNRWLLAGQKELLGDPDVTKFNTANYTFINEYAKVVSGSMGNTAITDSARKHANDVLSTAQTKDQYKQNIGLLKTEMRNRMLGFDQQRQELMGSMGGKTATTEPAAASASNPELRKKYGL